MTTSYLFANCTLGIQVSLSSGMIIKTGLFFFLSFRWIITPISMLWKIFKKLGEIKNKLRKIYPNYHENFKNTNSKSRVLLLTYKECTVIFITIGALCQSSYFSVMFSGNDCNSFSKVSRLFSHIAQSVLHLMLQGCFKKAEVMKWRILNFKSIAPCSRTYGEITPC